MKKIVMALVAVFCSAICAHAQENKDYTITITPLPLETRCLLINYQAYSFGRETWTGEGVHTGQLEGSIKIVIERGNEIPETPENTLIEVSMIDAYGKVAATAQDAESLSRAFEEVKFTRDMNDRCHLSFSLWCGGEYTYRVVVPGLNYQYEEKVVVKDEPYACVRDSDVKAGHDLLATAFFNTGYPYDPTSLSGAEEATMQLFYIDKNEQGETIETEVAKVEGRLFQEQAGPLLACYDSLTLGYAKPKPGKYRLKLSSNWQQEGANRDDIIINVEDPTGIGEVQGSLRFPRPHWTMFNVQCSMDEDVWFDLSGRKYYCKPTKPGVYIHDGKKVVIE